MWLPFKLRMIGFAGAIVALAVLIGSVAQLTWGQVSELREKLSEVQIESFRIADHFRATIQELDYTLLRYEVHKQQEDWDYFIRNSKALDRWIDNERPTLTSALERQVLDQINVAYDDYLSAARQLGKKAGLSDLESSLAEFKKMESESKRLLELGYQLANAHQQALTHFLSSSQQSLLLLRRLMFISLLLLLLLASWLGTMVYREMIKPLRLKLIESQAIIERQEKLASLGVLAAGVAHEIRNPLTAIKARLFTQQKRLSRNSPELEDATIIGNEINRLEQIVRDFLLFARPSEPQKRRLTAAEVFQQVADLMRPQLDKSKIVLQIGPVASDPFDADPNQIKQVLINLVRNASESIERDGVISMRSRNTAGKLGPGREVVLEVSDTGKGIIPEVQKRLFDPFFSTKESGTGLGLAISARILEKHQGTLEFSTEVNEGTSFQVILPAANHAA